MSVVLLCSKDRWMHRSGQVDNERNVDPGWQGDTGMLFPLRLTSMIGDAFPSTGYAFPPLYVVPPSICGRWNVSYWIVGGI